MASLLSRIAFRAIARASLWNPMVDYFNGTSTTHRIFGRTDDDTNAAAAFQNIGDGPALKLLDAAGNDILTQNALGMIFNGPWFNVLARHGGAGAVGDGQYAATLSITSGQAILTSSAAIFSASDEGKSFFGIAMGAAGAPLSTTILSYQSATQVTLAANAGTTAGPTGVGIWGTDDTAAVNRAYAAAVAIGGGEVLFPPLPSGRGYFLGSRIGGAGSNVTLRGVGMAQDLANAAPKLMIAHQSWPAVLLGGSSTASHNLAIRDISIMYPGTPTAVSTYEGDASYGAMIGLDRVGDTFIENVRVPYSYDLIAVGTVNNPAGVVGVAQYPHVHGNRAWFTRNGFQFHGAAYLDIGPNHFQDRSGTGSCFKWVGDGTTDGGRIYNVFCETPGRFLDLRLAASSGKGVNNLTVEGCLVDGVGAAALDINPAAGSFVAKTTIRNNTINHIAVANANYGVLIANTSTGEVQGVVIDGNEFRDMGRSALVISQPTAARRIRDIKFTNNKVKDGSTQADNTYDAISIDDNVTDYTIGDNDITSPLDPGAVNFRAGIKNGTGNLRFSIVNNRPNNMGTANYEKGTGNISATEVWKGNSGDVEPVWVGPFTSVDPGTSFSGAMQAFGNANFLRIPMPYAGRVVGIAMYINAVDAGAANRSATATVTINGASGTMAVTLTPDGAINSDSQRQDSGDTFAAGANLGIALVTGSAWSATTDIEVTLAVVPT